MAYEYEDEEYGGRVLWGRFIFWAAVILLAFLVGRWTAPEGSQEDLANAEATIVELRSENVTLQDQLAAEDPAAPPTTDAPAATATPTGGATPTEPAATEPTGGGGGADEARTYEVQPNDTLITIAEELYGDGSLWELIAEANNLNGETVLQAGQVLEIPPAP